MYNTSLDGLTKTLEFRDRFRQGIAALRKFEGESSNKEYLFRVHVPDALEERYYSVVVMLDIASPYKTFSDVFGNAVCHGRFADALAHALAVHRDLILDTMDRYISERASVEAQRLIKELAVASTYVDTIVKEEKGNDPAARPNH